MRFCLVSVFLLASSSAAFADLTQDQKVSDFLQLAGQYAKNYAPYELKRDVFGFDLYVVQPWLTQVKASKTDLEFFDICTRYIASLQDSHDEYIVTSDFDAWLHFDADIYDGKVLIDYIDRTYLARARYPFTTGDELVSVDGVAVADLVKQFQPYSVNGSSNPVSRNRLAVGTITERYQGWYPYAVPAAKSAVVVVKRASTGNLESYTVTWDLYCTPVTTAGIVPSPSLRKANHKSEIPSQHGIKPSLAAKPFYRKGLDSDNPRLENAWGVREQGSAPATIPAAQPSYMVPLSKLRQMSAVKRVGAGAGLSGLDPFGSIFSVFNPPSSFKYRLGLASTDYFLSGTFTASSYRVGFIRIPDMDPDDQTTALAQFAAEIKYFQQNTDGLVIDVMANGGGDLCYTQTLTSYLMPKTFRAVAEEVRATLSWQYAFSTAIDDATSNGAPSYMIALLNMYLTDIKTALTQNRARTGSLPICGVSFDVPPASDSKGNNLAYTKPILILTDNFTLSSGETFTMMLQDESRATVFGTRTDGGGGSVVEFPNATAYAESDIRITEGLVTRSKPVQVPGFPLLNYYDGVGIYPDIQQDYQTLSNLSTGGTPFVNAFSKAISDLITQSKS